MDNLLVLAGLGGLAIALVNLVRPLGRLGLVNRKRAGALLGASFLTILAGGAIAPEPSEGNPVGAGVTTTTVAVTATDPNQAVPPAAELVTVVSIIDGDTLTVDLSDGRSDTVRLIGIDAPEVGECFADDATDVLIALAPPGSHVGLTFDVSDTDQFDRLLRYIWVGEMSVNEELVRRGAAIARRYPPDTAMADRLESAESAARTAERGLWGSDACLAS